MTSGYGDLKNELISAANGVAYAYRDTSGGGDGAVPLVLLQHFRGNLDNWDPALVDALASTRRVVAFDNAGVGGSTGTTPDTISRLAGKPSSACTPGPRTGTRLRPGPLARRSTTPYAPGGFPATGCSSG